MQLLHGPLHLTALLPPPSLQVLRLALYELLFQSLAPHALSEYVQLTRRTMAGNEGAVRLVNAVLREAGRQLEADRLPDPTVSADTGGVSMM